MKILNTIQKELKAPKGQKNTFGNYKYRSCEDILEAVKPLLGDSILTINDEIIMIGDRYYVKATATLKDGEETISVSAFARESLDKKGMDSSQVTGATSSYARKYALNGLFCIDDTKDADTDELQKTAKVDNTKQQEEKQNRPISLNSIKAYVENGSINSKILMPRLNTLLNNLSNGTQPVMDENEREEMMNYISGVLNNS